MDKKAGHAGQELLGPNEPGPADVTLGRADSKLILVADHAGRAIPERLGGLGLGPKDLARHIAWDIGIAGVAAHVAAALAAPLARQRYSRLVIDCNRDPASPAAVAEVSDGTRVPGNIGLSAAERAARVAEVHAPYHAAIADTLAALPGRPLLAALHSFTPVMAGVARPWRVGVLHMGNSPASARLLAMLGAEPDLAPVGDNEPYAMDGTDYTVPRHAVGNGLDYIELEIRQDLIADEAGQRAWGARVAGWLERLVD